MKDPLVYHVHRFKKPSTIYVCHDAGFFSCCSVTLRLILKHLRETDALPLSINVRRSFSEYKKDTKCTSMSKWFTVPCQNVLDALNSVHESVKALNSIDFLSFYENDIYAFDPRPFGWLISTFFNPNAGVRRIADILKTKYKIDTKRTAAFYYRGTDKNTEVLLPEKKIFYDQMKSFHEKGFKILVQSDELSFISESKEKYPVIEITELASRESQAHDAEILLAIVLLMSECAYLFMSTSNVSLWTLLYRRHNANVFQMHPEKSRNRFLKLKETVK